VLVFVPDVHDQTDDSDDQAAKRRNLIGSQAEVHGAGATSVLGGGCYFDDFDAHGLFLGRQGLVAFFQPLLELRILIRAGQAALAVVVDPGVDHYAVFVSV
jgi:hypothetical protein